LVQRKDEFCFIFSDLATQFCGEQQTNDSIYSIAFDAKRRKISIETTIDSLCWMKVDFLKEQVLINYERFPAHNVLYSTLRKLFILLCFIHEWCHLLTHKLNLLAGSTSKQSTPEHIGKYNFGHCQMDCGAAIEEILLNGLIEYGNCNGGTIYIIQPKDRDEPIYLERNIRARSVPRHTIEQIWQEIENWRSAIHMEGSPLLDLKTLLKSMRFETLGNDISLDELRALREGRSSMKARFSAFSAVDEDDANNNNSTNSTSNSSRSSLSTEEEVCWSGFHTPNRRAKQLPPGTKY
jgi:hypothetical protein